jgi:hypothetical protein
VFASFFQGAKLYLVAVFAAAKTVEGIRIWVNLHARGFIGVEGAFEHVVAVGVVAVVIQDGVDG